MARVRSHFRHSVAIRRLLLWVAAAAFVLLPGAQQAILADGGLADAGGPLPQRGYFSDLPFERIDMANGDLLLTLPLLGLSGDAGMDLRIQWSYNRNGGWKLGLTGLPTVVSNPDGPSGGNDVTLGTSDGTSHKAYLDTTLGSNIYVTADFWRYAADTRTVSLPNGWVATFENVPGYPVARLQEVHDVFGNSITPHWLDANPYLTRLNTVDQTTGGATRTVAFGWDDTRAAWMSFLGGVAGGGDRTWTFDWTVWGPNTYQLSAIHLPMGPPWQFQYGGYLGSPSSLTVTTPNGGTVAYAFGSQDGRNVVTSRSTGGRAISGATWTFQYGQNWSGNDKSGIANTPLGRHIEYRHRDVTAESIVGPNVVLIRQALTSDAEGALSSADYDYTTLPVTDDKSSYALSQTTMYQGGGPFTTAYGYSATNRADFHQRATWSNGATWPGKRTGPSPMQAWSTESDGWTTRP